MAVLVLDDVLHLVALGSFPARNYCFVLGAVAGPERAVGTFALVLPLAVFVVRLSMSPFVTVLTPFRSLCGAPYGTMPTAGGPSTPAVVCRDHHRRLTERAEAHRPRVRAPRPRTPPASAPAGGVPDASARFLVRGHRADPALDVTDEALMEARRAGGPVDSCVPSSGEPA